MADFNQISAGEIDWASSTGVEDSDGCILPAAKLYLNYVDTNKTEAPLQKPKKAF